MSSRYSVSAGNVALHYFVDESQENKAINRKIHAKLLPGSGWGIFHIFTSEDIDDVISRFFTVVGKIS